MDALKIIDMNNPLISGRELHARLEVDTPYHKWFPRMCEYGFTDGVDYYTEDKIVRRADGTTMPQTQHDHQLTLDMAKEICMLQRSEQGKAVRRYLLEVERKWNAPEAVMSRALQMANAKMEQLEKQLKRLNSENERLASKAAALADKAKCFDKIVDNNLNLSIRNTAKLLGVREKAFTEFLVARKYMYRDENGKLIPKDEYIPDLFVLRGFNCSHSGFRGVQPMVTPKGRETFRLLNANL